MNQVTVLREQGISYSVFEDEKLRYFFDEKNSIEGHKDENGKWHGLILFYDEDKRAKPYKTAEFSHGVLHGETKHFLYYHEKVGDGPMAERKESVEEEGHTTNFIAQLESVFKYDSGKLVYTELYERGRLREISYENGEQQGLYKKFHSNGTLMESGYTSDLGREGRWQEYDDKGVLLRVAEFLGDKRHGTEEIYNNAKLTLQTAWRSNVKDGTQVEFANLNSSLNHISYDDVALLKTETSYHNGSKEGVFRETYDGEVRVLGNFKHDLKEGVWEYFETQNVLIKKETFKEGRLDGPIVIVKSPSEVLVGVMVDGKREGQFDYIDPKLRRPVYSEVYKNGDAKYFIEYHTDGKPSQTGQLRNQVKDGVALRFDRSGNQETIYFSQGKKVEALNRSVNEEMIAGQLTSIKQTKANSLSL